MRHFVEVRSIVERLAKGGSHATESRQALAEMMLMLEARLSAVEAQLRSRPHHGPLGSMLDDDPVGTG